MLKTIRKWLEASPGHHKWRSYAVSLPFGVILATCPGISLFLPTSAHADDMGVNAHMQRDDASSLPYVHLEDYISQPGETKIQFLRRVGVELRRYADRTTYEACGTIASDGQRWGIVIGTSDSHIGCIVHSSKVPSGMVSTGESIHTHGRKNFTFHITEVDAFFAGAADGMRMQSGDVYHFSATDYGAPGYLATPDGLRYEDGHPGSEREVIDDDEGVHAGTISMRSGESSSQPNRIH